MSVEEEVKELAFRVPRPPNDTLPRGVEDAAISQFEIRTGVFVPASLRRWLRFTNGPCIGPGGLLGIGSQRRSLDMEQVLHSYGGWKEKGWLPIAGDGCGNYYVVDTTEGDCVYFIDTAINMEELAYVVASDVWLFLWFLLSNELDRNGWPFAREFVLTKDPEIVRCTLAPVPWAEKGAGPWGQAGIRD